MEAPAHGAARYESTCSRELTVEECNVRAWHPAGRFGEALSVAMRPMTTERRIREAPQLALANGGAMPSLPADLAADCASGQRWASALGVSRWGRARLRPGPRRAARRGCGMGALHNTTRGLRRPLVVVVEPDPRLLHLGLLCREPPACACARNDTERAPCARHRRQCAYTTRVETRCATKLRHGDHHNKQYQFQTHPPTKSMSSYLIGLPTYVLSWVRPAPLDNPVG